LTQDEVIQMITSGFGQGLEPAVEKGDIDVRVALNQLIDFLKFARRDLGGDMLSAVTAVDDGETFELIYNLVSIRPRSTRLLDPAFSGYVVVRVTVPKDEDPPVVPSVTSLFPGANQQEREIWDLMGIRFKGHPDLRRILLWEGFPGHPLRKDWEPLNVEIPWHLAGLAGFGGGMMPDAPAEARIAADGSGISEPIPLGTTPQSFNHPPTRSPKPTEKLHLRIGQGGVTDQETAEGPRGLEVSKQERLPEAGEDG
jgi:NADH:ubiquinone oxidoreductase subunit C